MPRIAIARSFGLIDVQRQLHLLLLQVAAADGHAR